MNISEHNEIVDSDIKDNMNKSVYIDDGDNDDDITLSTLSKKIDKLKENIDTILIILLHDVKNNCNKMSEHIDFIDNIYTKVKYPMEYVVDKINNTRKMLPAL